MPLWQSSVTWLRDTFGWSTSRRSWIERICFVGILLAGIAVWNIGSRLPSLAQVLLWALLVVAMLVLLRRGWLQFFGPVLFYDMLCSARRSRYFYLRIGYACFLLFVLFTVWLNIVVSRERDFDRWWFALFLLVPAPFLLILAIVRGRFTLFLSYLLGAYLLAMMWFSIWTVPDRGDSQQATRLASSFFENFIVIQLILVVLLTPAYVAGAISEEKDRKTMEFLLATDLRNREIVFSKFGARLANLSLFLLTGLPILGFLQFLGGVDPNLVMAGFAGTGLTMLGIASVSILCSVQFKRPRDAITVAYLLVLAYLILGTTLYGFLLGNSLQLELSFPIWFKSADGSAPTMLDALRWVNAGNPIAAISEIARTVAQPRAAGGAGANIATILPGLLGRYAIFHGVLSALCLFLAVVRLRRVALRQAYGKVRKARVRHRNRAPVSELPMVWKEVAVEGGLRLNLVAALVLASLFLFSMFFGVMETIYLYAVKFQHFDLSGRGRLGPINTWVRIAGASVAYLTILGVAVRASTSIGRERDKQTLDGLLTSPLDSRAILWGKFLGALLSVRLGWIWLGLIWGIGVVTGGLHVFALALVAACWLIYAAFFAMLGLWCSMVCKTTMRATVYTMLTAIGITFGHWLIWMCCVPLFMFSRGGGGDGLQHVAYFQIGLTPPAVIGWLSYHGDDFSRPDFGRRDENAIPGFCILGLFIYGVAGLIFWSSVLSPRFRKYCGRDEFRQPEGDPRLEIRDDATLGARGPPLPLPSPAARTEDWEQGGEDLREHVRGD